MPEYLRGFPASRELGQIAEICKNKDPPEAQDQRVLCVCVAKIPKVAWD